MSSDEYALPGTILRYFDLAASPYGAVAEDIAARRKAAPEGKLFFDRLLEFAEIDGEFNRGGGQRGSGHDRRPWSVAGYYHICSYSLVRMINSTSLKLVHPIADTRPHPLPTNDTRRLPPSPACHPLDSAH